MVSRVMAAVLLGAPFVKFMEPFGTQMCCCKVQTRGEGRIWGSPQSNELPLGWGAPTCLGHSLGSRMAEPDTPSPAANAIPLGLIGRMQTGQGVPHREVAQSRARLPRWPRDRSSCSGVRHPIPGKVFKVAVGRYRESAAFLLA